MSDLNEYADAGRAGFLIKGDYLEEMTYNFLDIVFYNNSSYVAKKTTVGNIPNENNEYWQLFAFGAKGEPGEKGPAGPQGEQGIAGIKGDPGTSISISTTSIEYAVSDSGTKIPEKIIDIELKDYVDLPDENYKKELFIDNQIAYFNGIDGADRKYDTGVFDGMDFPSGFLIWCGNTLDFPEYTVGYYRSNRTIPLDIWMPHGFNYLDVLSQEAYSENRLIYFNYLGKTSIGLHVNVWQPTIPDVPQGMYLWTRTIVTFSDSTSITMYSVAYSGKDTDNVHYSETTRILKNYFGDTTVVDDINSFAAAGDTRSSVIYALIDSRVVPGVDGLLTFFWHDQLWTMQLGFALNKSTHLQIRGRNNGGILDWSDWKIILDSENFSDYTIFQKMDADDAYINQTGLSPQLIDVRGHNLIAGYWNFWTVLNIGAYNDPNTSVPSYRTQLLFPYQYDLNDTEMFIRTAFLENGKGRWRQSRRVLHDNNYSDIIKKINGNLLTKKGTFVDLDQGAGAGQIGYINFVRITIKDNHADHTCYFGIHGRGWQFPLFLSVNFANSENNDPNLQSFYYWGNKPERGVYISKKTTSTWDLWCSKGGGYDVIEILQMNVDYGHFDVIFPNGFREIKEEQWIAPGIFGRVAEAEHLYDMGNSAKITASYSKPGLVYSEFSWLACWGANYEIRACHKNIFTYLKNIDNFFGMCIPYDDGHDVNDERFIRTTKDGIIPYQSGDYTNPHCSLGTESWVFNAVYTNNSFIHYLIGLKGLNLGNIYYKTYMEMDYSALLFGMVREDNDVRTPTIRIYLTNYGRSVGIYPNKDNDGLLGEQSLRWKQIFTVNSVVVGSDKREKKNISYIGINNGEDTYMSDDMLQTFIRELKPCIYIRKNGDSGRPHHGFISQDLEELIKKLGIDHAAFIKSPFEEEYEEIKEQDIENEDGTKSIKEVKVRKTRIIEGEYRYGLRPEEIISDVVRFIQIKDDEIQNQKKIIEDMQNRLKQLEDLIKNIKK